MSLTIVRSAEPGRLDAPKLMTLLAGQMTVPKNDVCISEDAVQQAFGFHGSWKPGTRSSLGSPALLLASRFPTRSLGFRRSVIS